MGNTIFNATKETLEVFRKWSDHLRFNDRFHLPDSNEQLVNDIVEYSIQYWSNALSPETCYFRARVNKIDEIDVKPLSDMGAPPREATRPGRLNPTGIPYLYLSSDKETAIAEVRPWMGANVTVASFS